MARSGAEQTSTPEKELSHGEIAKQELMKLFGALEPEEVIKLGARIELDRTENRFPLPHQAVISLMRPFLAAVRAPRVYMPQRMFCLPFEDLLTPDDPEIKAAGTIARASIAPMWKWVNEELIPKHLDDIGVALVDAQKEGDQEEAQRQASAMWAAGSAAMARALEDARGDEAAAKALTDRLGGARRFEDVGEMTKILSVAQHVQAMKGELPPKPIITLQPGHVTSIASHYSEAGLTNPGSEIYLLLIAMRMMLQPFPILKVFRLLSRDKDDRRMQRTDLNIAGDIVISALESDADAVANAARDPMISEDELLRKARRFAAAFKGITGDIGIHREGEWGQRMFKARSAVGEVIEGRVLNKADTTIRAALPLKGRKVDTSFSKPPNDESFEKAEARARALSDALPISDQLGIKAACQKAHGEVRKELDDIAHHMVDAIAKADPDTRENGQLHIATIVRLTELIANSDEADLLRRRCMAAINQTAMS